jgi:hypothetical protein
MELKFTPRKIKEIEDLTKRPIGELLAEFSVDSISKLIWKGADLDSADQALDVMEKEFNEGSDLYALYVEIMEKLQKSGFFPKGVDLSKVKEKLTEGADLNLDSLETSGNQESPQQ